MEIVSSAEELKRILDMKLLKKSNIAVVCKAS